MRNRLLSHYPPGRAGLKLEGYCIERAARLELRRIEYLMFDLEDDDPALAPLRGRHGIIQRFLMTTDFGRLRTMRPELDGRTQMKVVIWERDDGSFVIEDVIPEPPDDDAEDSG